ncbi:MAG: FHA domain-containing protein [Ignisphaera sp.]|uniref:FHA domain-containing protein n=1 Tax=Ignisphaera aggregans TaxID=334771 RepID=A0A7C4D1I5_9CREN
MSIDKNILIVFLKSISSASHQIVKLKPDSYMIGRDPDCDIVVADPFVSRKHAKIFYRDGKWFIEDVGSKNGTYVDGEDIRGRGAIELKEDMEIIMGFSVLIIKGFEES